jgi:DNA-binding transcriptional ArsR family regulator
MAGEDEKGFDAAKAELFEAIGHPNRIRIIQALEQGGMGFAELKKRVGMESSGHLAFHLGKLEHLVAVDANGQYVLTGEGREALMMIQTVREKEGRFRHHATISLRKPMIAALLVAIVLLAGVAAFQQLELANRIRPPGTTVLDGRPFAYAVVLLTSLPANLNTTIWFGGVEFTLIPFQAQTFLVRSLNSTAQVVPIPMSTYSPTNGTGVATGRVFTFVLSPPYNVQMRFADGSVETMITPTSSNSQGVSFAFFLNSPWFSEHKSPQAAVSVNMTAVTLYVSV